MADGVRGLAFAQGSSDDVKSFATSLTMPYCGFNSGFEAVPWLAEPASVASLALIPLRNGASAPAFGLLVLGSPDPTRYTMDMGTEFLMRIGDIASAGLIALLPRAMIVTAMSSVDAADTMLDADVARTWSTCACNGGSPIARWRCTAMRSRDCRALPLRCGCRCERCSRTMCGAGLRSCMRGPGLTQHRDRLVRMARAVPLARAAKALSLNPVEGVRAPKAPPAVAKGTLGRSIGGAGASYRDAGGFADAALGARPCIVELLYGCGLRIAELVGLDVGASAQARGWIDVAGARAQVIGKGSKRRACRWASRRCRRSAWLALRGTLAKPDERALFVSRRGTRLDVGRCVRA